MTWRWTVPLALLAALGAWLAPRLEAANDDDAHAQDPCFRWGAMECCYVEDDAFDAPPGYFADE